MSEMYIYRTKELSAAKSDEMQRALTLMHNSTDLSEKTGIKIITDITEISDNDLIIQFSTSGISLFYRSMEMQGDLSSMIPRLKEHNLNSELLVKAAGIKNAGSFSIIDATAGMGEDSLLLAAAGFQVVMYEKDPVIAALLRDSLRRAADNPVLKPAVERMALYECDSIETLNGIDPEEGKQNIIYLDPMFPERMKTGLVKKKFQLLHYLERPCDNEEELLRAAINSNPSKVIIKRPLKGKDLAGFKPSYSLKGKTVRYDCIVL